MEQYQQKTFKIMTKKAIVFSAFVAFSLILSSCNSCTRSEINLSEENQRNALTSFVEKSDFTPLDQDAGTVFYADASTVLIDAMNNSPVYKAMAGQIAQYVDDLVFIEGDKFDTVPCDHSNQTIFTALSRRTSEPETYFADILKAIENICNGNRQAMIITDFEQQRSGVWMDCNPYLSRPFKNWLQKGYQIDFLVEPYNEGANPKKRFYVFFTDPTDKASINHTMIEQVRQYIDNGTCTHYSFNAKDYKIVCTGATNSCEEEIEFSELEDFTYPDCQTYITTATWEDIKENLMKLDDHDRPMEDEKEIPLIDNLKIVDGTTYTINDIVVKATNISKPFFKKAVGDSDIENPDETWDISDAFETKIVKGMIQIYVKKEILKNKHLFSKDDGFEKNLIKLEFFVPEKGGYTVKKYDPTVLEWTSCIGNTKGETANCVSLSLDNAIYDVAVTPTNRLLYTIFIQTESIQ